MKKLAFKIFGWLQIIVATPFLLFFGFATLADIMASHGWGYGAGGFGMLYSIFLIPASLFLLFSGIFLLKERLTGKITSFIVLIYLIYILLQYMF